MSSLIVGVSGYQIIFIQSGMDIYDQERFRGLTSAEVSTRLKHYGFNELPSSKPKSVFSIILKVLHEPMFILLVACGVLYIFLGDRNEGIMLLSSVLIVIAVSYYQERKAERSLEALSELSSPRALVIRDGEEKRIAGREVVKDDLIVMQEGDRVCADATVLYEMNLRVDESLLTGESMPVKKSVWKNEKISSPGGDETPFVYSGTLVVGGHGVAKVIATGMETEMGKIGKSLQQISDDRTLLQKETKRIVAVFLVFGFVFCLSVVLIYGLARHSWMNGVLSGLSVAMAMLPEEFAVVLAIFFAIGASRMAKHNVLTRHASAIERLGSITVLCADKTGTLTLNKMSLRKIFAQNKFYDLNENDSAGLPEDFHQLLEYSILAGQEDPFDPMERAIKEVAEKKLSGTEHLHRDWILVEEYALSHELTAMSRVFKSPNKKDFVIAAKGSPEAIEELCHLSKEKIEDVKMKVIAMASEGLRVLGVARATFSAPGLPGDQHEFDFKFAGLLGFADPVRESVGNDVKQCYDAGIRVVMITGDYPVTAKHIAQQVGLRNAELVITGSELETLSMEELQEKIQHTNIFARVVPEQKLKIVTALKANHEIVAMTGDGVNDAPALKAADVGIAMGARGTDVAREASSLVLLDDNFSSITAAIRMGRRIYDNMEKAMGYIFAVHFPIAGLTLIPLLSGNLPIILFPLHIAFLELIIDPSCTLIFEAEEDEKNIMKRPPRIITGAAFGIRKILVSSMQGLSVLVISLAVYAIALYLRRPENEIRALTFTTLIVANIGLILINRSWTRTIIETVRQHNPMLKWVIGGAISFLILVLYVPFLRSVFRLEILHVTDILICLGAGVISVLWFELMKVMKRYRRS
ncbi:MAG TPA: cation-translocating P-type ATPase [Chitinophagales bacterium]|nr:cation-translocating P-type ATPase [Chitinophagales bacterium]